MPPTLMSRSESLGLSARHEGVGKHHAANPGAAGPSGQVGADPLHRRSERGLMGAHGEAPGLAQGLRVEVGEAVDRHRTVHVGQLDGTGGLVGVGAQVNTGVVDQPRPEAQPLGGVVVAAGDHHPRPGGREPGEGLVGEPHRVDGRQRPVVDVAGEDDQVDLLGHHDLDQVVDEGSLMGEHALPVEGPPQVPVGGVEDPHAPNLGSSTDTPALPRRAHPPGPPRGPSSGAAEVRRSGPRVARW